MISKNQCNVCSGRKKYYKKTIIYSEEKIDGNILIKGEFTEIKDVTKKKDELIECYGEF